LTSLFKTRNYFYREHCSRSSCLRRASRLLVTYGALYVNCFHIQQLHFLCRSLKFDALHALIHAIIHSRLDYSYSILANSVLDILSCLKSVMRSSLFLYCSFRHGLVCPSLCVTIFMASSAAAHYIQTPAPWHANVSTASHPCTCPGFVLPLHHCWRVLHFVLLHLVVCDSGHTHVDCWSAWFLLRLACSLKFSPATVNHQLFNIINHL